ncbi:YhcN/YlaJ family sporulation lipoprotein [Paenibacillus barcinonensis]|uniref:YhcN/YlaJ family sporulation lipoprotein n=1 Tax=Paenibacillus barcinonensis TaxID=198119 RepID=A0A2V4VMA7_PAEBA|nr:YhcN/YlaJ family sporulation lipoprotein [Paenibacillus barcinonensis]PYE47412.1 YhcN/YlaJ family sporulation lipoprotein [Paenibacillus barcinonensis]QKS56333.1 YhcN/YlaJ family sporulation lipoprotein [Paenibacillus barcinonensis]
MKMGICTLLLIFILTGCNSSTRNASQELHEMHPRSYGGNITTQQEDRMHPSRVNHLNEHTDEVHNLSTADETETGRMTNQKRVSHLKALAKQVEGVKDANCVILGNTAVVGIDVDGDLERARVGTIKYSVAEALRKDPEGVDSIVTADADVTERIKEIGEHIRKGHPISGFASELADMVGRIIPQLPKDVKVRQNPDAPAQDQYMQQHNYEKRQQKAQ